MMSFSVGGASKRLEEMTSPVKTEGRKRSWGGEGWIIKDNKAKIHRFHPNIKSSFKQNEDSSGARCCLRFQEHDTSLKAQALQR